MWGIIWVLINLYLSVLFIYLFSSDDDWKAANESWISLFCFKTQVVTNCKNTVQGFKRFHGRAFSDPFVQSMKSSLVYELSQMPTGTTGIKVSDGEMFKVAQEGATGIFVCLFIWLSLLTRSSCNSIRDVQAAELNFHSTERSARREGGTNPF